MSGAGVLVLAAIVVVVGWWVDVQRRPIRRCPSCDGSKKNAGDGSRYWGTCRRCGGKGEVRRLGAPKKE
jgi:DnaJ-class molecular chaperone